tara:strand:+ start:1354 stop:2658 length:1305 start_codon:yes stop_codon:yes gene_type:complete
MPIFSRRRLQAMLDDIRPLLAEKKKENDLLARLRNKKPEQVLGAEMELALLWAIKQVSDIEIEPSLPNSSRIPEAFSENLFDIPAYIEITTLSDGDLSGEKEMQRAAQKITSFSNSIKKGRGSFLYYRFQERSGWEEGKYFRQRCVTSDFELDDIIKEKLQAWIPTCRTSDYIRLHNNDIDVVLEVKLHKQKEGFNYWCSLPPLAYDLTDNPLYKRLLEKEKQLSGAPDNSYKVIFLTDGGSRLLRKLTETDPQNLYKSGQAIISNFMGNSKVDMVMVFSPKRESSYHTTLSSLNWQVSCFLKDNKNILLDKANEFLSLIPAPRFEGYQARSIQKQGAFAPLANGWYLGNHITSGRNVLTMKISARALQEYLAGTINQEQFERHISSGDKNLFQLWLLQGHTISDITFEKAGIDEDDDLVVFQFNKDPAATNLK